MTDSQQVYDFLAGVRDRNVTATLPAEDLTQLQQLDLIQVMTADQYAQTAQQVQELGAMQGAIQADAAKRAQLGGAVEEDQRREHSIMFHLEGQAKRTAEQAQEQQDRSTLQAVDSDLAAREQQFNQLVAKRSLMDTLVPFPGGYVGLTGLGAVKLRELGIRLYRVSDIPFSTYWEQSQQVDQELNNIADRGAWAFATVSAPLTDVDRSYLWAIAVGLAKQPTDLAAGATKFLEAFVRLREFSPNDANRLMSAEMLSTLPRPITDDLPLVDQLRHEVHKLGVPKESSLGVASILLLGRREDGTFSTSILPSFLKITRSYESAALLSIVNEPFDGLVQKFNAVRAMFNSWGFAPSEDVELSSAYLTISDLPIQGMSTKLAIIAKGLGAYLQYPLVASSVLASIPVLEANDSLNLLEDAYGIIGKRAMPLTQPELICLAVRMLHGIRAETVTGVDTTAVAAPTAARMSYGWGPGMYFFPMLVVYGAYYSTFSGIEGAHPGHAHAAGGVAVG
jgi:hypothetical protein